MDIIEKDSLLTDENQNQYYVYNTTIYNNKNYAVCIEYENPQNVVVFTYRNNGNGIEIQKEIDENIIQIVLASSLKKEN